MSPWLHVQHDPKQNKRIRPRIITNQPPTNSTQKVDPNSQSIKSIERHEGGSDHFGSYWQVWAPGVGALVKGQV
jgi:hypothetical protein